MEDVVEGLVACSCTKLGRVQEVVVRSLAGEEVEEVGCNEFVD